jgi:hypothetical protein
MTKAVYYVKVVRKGREREFEARQVGVGREAGRDSDLIFEERIRASNRREALVLARRQYPDHQVVSSDRPRRGQPTSAGDDKGSD